MTYRMTREIEFPFKVYPQVTQLSTYSVLLTLRIHCNLKNSLAAKMVGVTYLIPSITKSVYNDNDLTDKKSFKVDYNQQNRMVSW